MFLCFGLGVFVWLFGLGGVLGVSFEGGRWELGVVLLLCEDQVTEREGQKIDWIEEAAHHTDRLRLYRLYTQRHG